MKSAYSNRATNGQRLKLLFVAFFMAFTTAMMAQATVSGTVLSEEEQIGLPGVNIIIKGTSKGVSTDVDGRFTITADSKEDVLVFSYIGYQTQEIRIGDNTDLRVELRLDAEALEEVIVLGYSEKTKTELSSAVVSLNADEVNKVTVNNVEDMLIGRVAGVQVQNASGQPGQAAQMRIRGVGSAFSPQSPLIVVDGIVGASYNPNDIESITVLKDAGATGLYGSRAAAGVVIIKTRSGQSSKPVIQARILRGIKQAETGNFQMMNADELWNYHKLIFDPQSFPTIRPAELRKRDFNWVDNAYSDATVQRYFLSINSKREKFDYYISADYFDDEGTALNSAYERLTLNTKVSYQLTDRLNITTRIFGQAFKAKYPHWTYTEGPFRMIPWDNPYDENGDPIMNVSNWYSNTPNNIFHSSRYNRYGGNGTSFEGNMWVEYRIFDWLKVTSWNSAGAGFSKYEEIESPKTIEGAPTNGRIANSVAFSQSFGSTNLLRFDHKFGIHAISGFAGIEGGAYVEEFDIGGSGLGIFPGQEVLSVAGNTIASGNKRESRGFSILSQLNYNFDQRYFLTASFRRDGSSKFGPENRYANFYTVAGSWLISNEQFFNDNSAVHYLKLRASYGSIGNETFPNNTFYPYFPSYSFIYQYNNGSAAFPINLGNAALSWESSNPLNVGVDIGFLNRFEANLDFYNTITRDLLFQDPTAYSQGFQFQWKNVGEIQNTGLELAFNGLVVDRGAFKWNLGFNIGANQNKLLKLSDKDVEQIQVSANDIYQVFRKDEVPFSWYMPKWLGVNPDNGDPQWEKVIYDPDSGAEIGREVTNSYSQATFQVVGDPFPDFTGGFNTVVSWKGLALNASLAFVYGNDVYNATRKEIDNDGANNNVNALKLQDGWSRWERPGDVATHPKPTLGGNKNAHEHSSRFLEDGSYLRVRNVTLSYDFPPAITSRLRLQQLQLRISADNLLTFSNFSGMDPDVPLYRTSTFDLPGLSAFKYPISRQILAGIEIQF